ncbi:MAG: RagB/SusD family nutrient uptake outer membrane protein [Proteiniphilum sp.]|uniref:RagB/SusD family nutrient uptake outer membrane protein n=1 Tax=Proteiniphilum sp. TaxID=1926877 RepID=UPI002ABC2574|nr:RagB/SusD family nutrient uptake outer membrane protein [Proteiniphilum sp.]MDY9919327.1 RagB/SusD family nutrient uptake outer membrane protein [Proteiniphilum sp.]
MKNISIIIVLSVIMLMITGCEDFLNRPQLTQDTDETAWTSEQKVRLYANKFYPTFFVGYSNDVSLFTDDVVQRGNQGNFTRAVPNSAIWSMTSLRSINIMIDRVGNRMEGVLSEEAYNHWMGVGRFFRGLRYSELVFAYGDVPYYDHVVSDIDKDDLYKPRTPRNEVMDAVYDDLKFAFANVRLNDGDQSLNRYIVAGFISRIALYEGTWQKYYYKNNARAEKFLAFAMETAEFLMNSGRYAIDTDFRSLFTSNDLKNNRECILYRKYDNAVSVTHSVAHYNNPLNSINYGGTTALLKSFICVDGKVWQNSDIEGANDFRIASLVKTRDSRFEGTFYDKPNINAKGSFLFPIKFYPRYGVKKAEEEGTTPDELKGSKNITDAPVLRYAEILLNWIEAKAELASIGGDAVTQADLDRTINLIRNRPLAPEAIEKGVQKTAPLMLDALPDDPGKDPNVSPLLWEIRRERRMEFIFEDGRLIDLKRWYKLEYMDTDSDPELLTGAWVNFPAEANDYLASAKPEAFSVTKADGSVIVYNGTNGAQMVGFYKDIVTNGRQPFLNQVNVNPYLSPVGKTQIDDYASRGYVLQQTEGWPQN